MPAANSAPAREKNETVKRKNFVPPADDEAPSAFSATPSKADGGSFATAEPAERLFGVPSGSSAVPSALSEPSSKADGVPSVISEVVEKIFGGFFAFWKTSFFSSEPPSATENPESSPYFIRTLAKNGTVGGNRPSEVGDQIAHPHPEGFGDSRQRFHRNFIFSAFDVPYVISRKIRLFREFFLAQTSFNSFNSDCFTENFGYSTSLWHNMADDQEYPQHSTKHTWYFFPCIAFGRVYSRF
jgi:hypothetical protein